MGMDPGSTLDRGECYYSWILRQEKKFKKTCFFTHTLLLFASYLEVISKFKEDFSSQGEALSGDHNECTKFSTLLLSK